MRNCFVSAEAIPLYAAAARGAPQRTDLVVTFSNRAAYLGMAEIAIEAVAALGPAQWSRVAWLHEEAGHPELARAWYRKAVGIDPRRRTRAPRSRRGSRRPAATRAD